MLGESIVRIGWGERVALIGVIMTGSSFLATSSTVGLFMGLCAGAGALLGWSSVRMAAGAHRAELETASEHASIRGEEE